MYGKSERFEDYDGASKLPVAMATAMVGGSAREMPPMRRAGVLYVASGSLRLQVNSAHWICAPGGALSLPSGNSAKLHAASTCRLIFAFLPSARSTPTVQKVIVTDLFRALLGALAEIPTNAARTTRTRLLGGLFVNELQFTSSSPIHLPWPASAKLARVSQAIVEDPSRPLTVAQAARLAGMAPRTLSRWFASETGLSMGGWQRAARLTVALSEIAKGGSVYSAAAASGFSTASGLCAAFRRASGTTLRGYFKPDAGAKQVRDEALFFSTQLGVEAGG
ncbi:helix-turn-helix transcriptional regulator [Caenimonas sedimenti]|uniref:Helix-turn-helix transcriptional regulator n=1 Tax=Caenimonas sedimenti TaxID=2596921 RepID=A0A562ZE32_9BURK|nr:AraC family transcriptional regulator [Caenimonas sedimenti]TWO64435.1 helix-turn-helix transcriptional regulator [Caenimonas sedimenti]